MAEYKNDYTPEVIIEAHQWHKNGDHPLDDSHWIILPDGEKFLSEGAIVRRYNHPNTKGSDICKTCEYKMQEHGWIDNEFSSVVCPGDYIYLQQRAKRAGTESLYVAINSLAFESAWTKLK